MTRTDIATSRTWFKHLAEQAEYIGIHPENRQSLEAMVLQDTVDRFAGINRAAAVAAFDVLVEVVDRHRDERDERERDVLEQEIDDALRVLVPDPVVNPLLRVVAS